MEPKIGETSELARGIFAINVANNRLLIEFENWKKNRNAEFFIPLRAKLSRYSGTCMKKTNPRRPQLRSKSSNVLLKY